MQKLCSNSLETTQPRPLAKLLCFAGAVFLFGIVPLPAQPVIPAADPADQTVIAGTVATFLVNASGTPPLTNQWRRYTNTTVYGDIPGATNSVLVLSNAQSTSHHFALVVSDNTGSSTSRLARLIVVSPPSFTNTNQPAGQFAEVGDTVTFAATAAGTGPLSYQWRWNDTNLPGKTSTNLVLANAQFTNAGGYTLVVTNLYGAATSRVATVTVLPAVFTKVTNGPIVNDGGHSFGAAWGDYDNDGFVDLFVCNQPENSGVQHDFLYRNNGDGTFSRITNGPAVNAGSSVFSAGAAWGDYDNDGFLDLFVSRPSFSGRATTTTNNLYHNQGDGTFISITTGSLVTLPIHAHAGVWADINNDGYLDLCVASFGDDPPAPAIENYLYKGRGNGDFDRVSLGHKVVGNGNSWNLVAADFNNDGWTDLFIPQGGIYGAEPGLLYTNSLGSLELVTNSVMSAQRAFGVGCAWGDFDNDGFLDLFVSNIYDQDNFLYRNNRDGTFTKMTNSIVGRDHGNSVGCAWADYDNDGWLDLFVANLGPVNSNSFVTIREENNFLYHNNGDGTFTKVTSGKLVNDLGYSTGCAWADYDNDGFLDLFVANGWQTASQNNFLYHNNGNANNWITLKLVGTVSNRSAIGAKVRVKATIGGRTFWQMREISGGSNYGSQNDLRASFGLGDATSVETLRIEWPSGTVQELHHAAAKQFLILTEPPRLLATKTSGAPQFTIQGGRGFSYLIETSTNLPDWSPLGPLTITNQNGNALIHDTNAPGPQRFYRATAP